MKPRCPHCNGFLDQLGYVIAGPNQTRIWVAENLYACRECPYGRNRFTIVQSERGSTIAGVNISLQNAAERKRTPIEGSAGLTPKQ